MADKTEKMVPLYFIGVHYHPTKALTFTIKNRVYQPELDEKGQLKLGGVMMVNEHDAKAVIDKSRVYRRNVGFFETFTLDAQIGAQVKRLAEQGKAQPVPARTSLAQALALAGQASKEEVVAEMSVAELEAALAAKLAKTTNDALVSYTPVTEEQVAEAVDKPVEKISDEPVEKDKEKEEKPKGKPGRPPRDSEVVDEIIAKK